LIHVANLAKYSYAQEDVAYLNVIHNKMVYDEGNGWSSPDTERGQHNMRSWCSYV